MKNYSILYQVILNYYRARGKVRKEEKKNNKMPHDTHTFYNLYTHSNVIQHFLLHSSQVPYNN